LADKKITQLNNITGANLANTDEFVVVDVSADETMAVTREQFFLSVPAITVDGDVIIGDDLFVSGPNPVINIVETGVNQHRILGTGGSLYIQAQDSDGTTDGDMHLTGYNNNDLGLLRIKAANTTITGDVTIGDDLFLSGPNPAITLFDTDIADEYTKLQNGGGVTYLDSRNGVSNGPIVFRGQGGGVNTEFARFDGSGHAIIPAGVTLGTAAGVYAAANTLDDYEEGTWTPAISDGTNVGTTNIAVGSYTKTGNHVHVQGRVRLSSLGSVSGSIRLTGLPFSSQAVTNNFSAMTIGRAAGLNITAGTTVCGDLRVNVSHALLVVWDVAAGTSNMQATEFSANGDISFSMDYLSN